MRRMKSQKGKSGDAIHRTRQARGSKSFKVFVGLSGGVDSAVSAALLKKAGHHVTGVFIKVWQPDWIECNWKEERLEAIRVAAHLDIPFVTLDLADEYKRGVIDYMIAEYAAGRTPNPDVMCNREVKFGAFWRWAEKQGADYIATGHYARVQGTGDRVQGRGYRIITGKTLSNNCTLHPAPCTLLAGSDSNKDQSYFLWTLDQNDLNHVLFPVGGMTKPEVRKLAVKFKLPNADKKDSQGLCFIGKVDVKEFLRHYIKTKPGNVLNEAGETIGKHPGALLFTIGERHGFTVDSSHKSPDDQAFYVVGKDAKKNTITVSNRGHSITPLIHSRNDSGERSLSKGLTQIKISRTNWVSGMPPSIGAGLKARSRYRQPLQDIKIISIGAGQAEIEFKERQDALTPGQSLVIYDGDECIGGGIIEVGPQ